GRTLTPAQAWRSPRCHSPRAVADRHAGVGAFHAPDPAFEAGRAAWTWRQGWSLRPRHDTLERCHSRLHAAWRLAALSAQHIQGRALRPHRTRADESYRSVPVRKRLRSRRL